MKRLKQLGLAAMASAVALVASALPAQAWSPSFSDSELRMSACSWDWKIGSTGTTGIPVYLKVGGNPWSAASRAPDNGANQNFAVLAQNAVGEWNGRMVDSPGFYGMTYSTSTSGADIRLYSGTPTGTDPSLLGITYRQLSGDDSPGTNRCFENLPQDRWPLQDIIKANIYNRVSDTWFTQYGNDQWGRDVRKEWEKCFTNPATNDPRLADYTCKKQYDFGSVVTHELGHAIGLIHPNIGGDYTTKAQAAKCGVIALQATMCANIPPGRSAQRTPEPYDHDIFARAQTFR